MRETFEALAVSNRKIAVDYVDQINEQRSKAEYDGEKIEDLLAMAQHHRSEADKYDDQAEQLRIEDCYKSAQDFELKAEKEMRSGSGAQAMKYARMADLQKEDAKKYQEALNNL